MSTATVSSGILTAATITKASTATIRKVERANASARPIRFTKPKKDTDSITPSSSVEHMSSRSTDATDYQSSPLFAGDQTLSTNTTSLDTTLRSPSGQLQSTTSKFDGGPSLHTVASLHNAEPNSFFSDSFSANDSAPSLSTTLSDLTLLHPETLQIAPASRRGSDQADKMSHSPSYQSAASSLARSAQSFEHTLRAPNHAGSRPSSSAKTIAKFGLGIQSRGPIPSPHSQQLTDTAVSAAGYLAGPSLEVVPEVRESPFVGSRTSQTAFTPDTSAPSSLTISTATPFNNEPVWGASSSAGTARSTSGPMAAFSFPSPVPSSAGFIAAPAKPGLSGSLSTGYQRSPGSTFHSSNPSMQSSASNLNGRHLFSSKASDASLLQASTWSHAPPSSYGGSIISSVAGNSVLDFPRLNPSNRDDMLQRLLLDQARVDCQEYDSMSLEQVAETKRDLKHVDRKVQSLRTKLKVEIKIRDAAVALRKAHRRTAASAHSPTSSVTLAVSPTSPGFMTAQMAGPSSASSASSFAARSRARTISATEAKADEDVTLATAKVDKVANELFRWTERANSLRRKLLEHQAATLSERVHNLESDRQVMEEKLPFLTTSASFESLAPSASASAVGIARYRDPGHRYQPSADEAYIPRGPEDPLRHNRLESDLSAISGFSFLDATAPEKLRRLGDELERKRDMVRKLESDLDSARAAAQRHEEATKRLNEQLEVQSRERSLAVEQLRTLKEQLNHHDNSARQAQALAVQAAIADVEQRTHKQIEQGRSRDQEREDALVNARAEVMATQRALTELQTRLATAQEEAEAQRLRAETAEYSSVEHRRELNDLHSKSASQLSQGSHELATIQAELQSVRAEQDAAAKLAEDRGALVTKLEEQLNQSRDEVSVEQQARKQAEQQVIATRGDLTVARKQNVDTQTRADEAEVKLRELELAVAAERRIMAERDELFHAFERRLESAEQRLQEQDKRCARMLGKLEGREEMDDLLERIKAGAAGVAKKEKTAGQDIAGLLSSLETHIGDLELELSRANAQLAGSPNGSNAASQRSALATHHTELETALQEAQRWKAEAERLEHLLESQPTKQQEPSQEGQSRLQQLEAELRTLSEQSETSKRQGLEQVRQLEEEVRTLSEQSKDLERQNLAQIEQLESKLERLELRNRELEKQLRTASKPTSPSGSVDALPLRTSKSASPYSPTIPLQNKGVGNLIDRFGGGRKISSEIRSDDSPAMLQACMRSVEGLRAMLPDLTAAAKGSADLHALRDAFQACGTSPTSPTNARSPSSLRASVGAAELQAELDAMAERLRCTLAISRALIDLALESDADKENRDHAKPEEHGTRAQSDTLSSQRALMTRLTSLTAKVKDQAEREKSLETELRELKGQLQEARAMDRAPLSPCGLTPGSASMLGLSTSPARAGDSNFFSMPRKPGHPSSSKSMRGLLKGDKPSPISTGAYIAAGATLAPPRSPSGVDTLPSPTRSNASAHSSPSVRYISPFAPRAFEGRTQQTSLPEPHYGNVGNVALSENTILAQRSDSTSLRSNSSPSSTHLGLPSSAANLSGTHPSSMSEQRAAADPLRGASPTPTGMIKRTITLGMDVPQLMSRVRELENQLLQTASIRQRAERVAELEAKLREANQSYAKLLDTLDAERNIGTHQKAEMLNELNDAQSKLQTTQAQIQRAQTLSPFHPPRPPAKD